MSKTKERRTICIIFSSVIILWGLAWFLITTYIDKSEIGDNKIENIWAIRGTFGDMFGAINALFSGLAFAGMITALCLQRKEFRLQRKEFELQRKELKNSNEALKAQEKEMEGQRKEMEQQKKIMEMQQKVAKIQCFESTLFQLCSMQQKILNGLSMCKVQTKEIYNLANGTLKEEQNKPIKLEGRDLLKDMVIEIGVEKKYSNLSNMASYNSVKHYFSHLNRIFTYIDTSEWLTQKDPLEELNLRHMYIEFITDELSSEELKLLYFNNLENGFDEAKKTCEKYAIFNAIRNDWKTLATIKSGYDASAYDWDACQKKFKEQLL